MLKCFRNYVRQNCVYVFIIKYIISFTLAAVITFILSKAHLHLISIAIIYRAYYLPYNEMNYRFAEYEYNRKQFDEMNKYCFYWQRPKDFTVDYIYFNRWSMFSISKIIINILLSGEIVIAFAIIKIAYINGIIQQIDILNNLYLFDFCIFTSFLFAAIAEQFVYNTALKTAKKTGVF